MTSDRHKKYQQIKTLDELDAAIARSREVLSRKGERLRRGIVAAQSFYTPSTLLSEGVRHTVGSLSPISVAGVLLSLVSRIRRRRKKK